MQAGHEHASLYPTVNTSAHAWPSSTDQTVATWSYTPENPAENAHLSNDTTTYYDPQRDVLLPENNPGSTNPSSHMTSAPGMNVANSGQDYAAYSSYASSAPYGYQDQQYQNYYYNYQQTVSNASTQQTGGNQNSGAAYQPLSSFPNSVGPTSNLNTYYNTGGHQTAAGYESSNYYYQPSIWNHGSTGSNAHQYYSSYPASDASAVQTSSQADPNFYHYQEYNQWPYYYNQSMPNVSGPPSMGIPGNTTNTVPTVTATAAYSYHSVQPPPPGTTSWRGDSANSGVPSLQVGGQSFQSQNQNQIAAFSQVPVNVSVAPINHDDEQKKLQYQAPLSHVSSNSHVPNHHQSFGGVSSTPDEYKVSKIQIPTNPRIAPGFSVGIAKSEKKSFQMDQVQRAVYVDVSTQKSNVAQNETEGNLKGAIPVSFRNYVERTFARCKNDGEREANQHIMKEMFTKATADGTLFTKNWDMEPLFILPSNTLNGMDAKNEQLAVPFSSISTRRTKSRWEPVSSEEKVVEMAGPSCTTTENNVNHNPLKAKQRTDVKSWYSVSFISPSQPLPSSKFTQKPNKKQKISSSMVAKENGDASGDDADEQSLTKYYASAVALANAPEEKKRREQRSKRFDKGHIKQSNLMAVSPATSGGSSMHSRRANAMLIAKSYEDSASLAVEDMDWDALTVKGTCQEIEKRYLRLTSAPDPSTVRPEDVLEKALRMVETSEKNYLYKCDQLKSIRQDLTVQRIQNDLTVKVYETHARLALQAGDLPEYNQCQSQLRRLYAEGITGNHLEFSAYHLLCVILHSKNRKDLLSSMASLSEEAKQDKAVKHALAVHSAVSSGNYVSFFRLHRKAPNLNTCLMDLYVEKIRFEAVKCMSKSYRPIIPVSYVARVLGFFKTAPGEGDGDEKIGGVGLEDCEIWLKAHGAILSVDSSGETLLDAKASSTSLFMPEPQNAVSHGDTSLAVDDFLTRAV